MIVIYVCVWVLCLPLYICLIPSSFSQRLWLMSFMTFCGGDLFSDLILWKGQPEILKKLWVLVDYTMSYFSFPEEVLATRSRGQKGVSPDCQYLCRRAIWTGYGFRIQFEAKMLVRDAEIELWQVFIHFWNLVIHHKTLNRKKHQYVKLTTGAK
jgi:hypothetical protein